MLERTYPLCFILIVFTVLVFMIIAMGPTCPGLTVMLPVTRKADVFTNLDNLRVITLQRDGSLYLDGDYIPDTGVNVLDLLSRQKVVMKVDTRTRFQDVRQSLRLLSDRQIRNVVLITESQIEPIDRIVGM